MLVFRKRLLFWLIKAYMKRWGKVIILSFIGGLGIFFLLLSTSRLLVHLLPIEKKVVVGAVGAYTTDILPVAIEKKISFGLTQLAVDGSVIEGAATSWKIEDNGKKYTFYLKKTLRFSDGRKFTTNTVNYDFSDVTTNKPDQQTIVFTLKDPYSPFLVTVSRPLYSGGLTGIGEYKIQNLELNGDFIKSLTLVSTKNRFKTERYIFYPTEEALKVAFALGEINRAVGLIDTTFRKISFASYPKTRVLRKTDYTKLVTIFFNNHDQVLSDKKIRNGLTYALPETFSSGERSYVPYPPQSQYHSNDAITKREQDFEHAKVLIDAATSNASASARTTIHLKALSKYMGVADEIVKAWRQVGVDARIEKVDSIPTQFQAYLGDFNLPKDPDQYVLWHSNSSKNITRYKNLRIDKLLEDGRTVADTETRKELYADFQKYLLDDSPASFLFFPYEYEIQKN